MSCWSAGWLNIKDIVLKINQKQENFIHFCSIKRRWREVGEQPCLWSSLKLKFVVGSTSRPARVEVLQRVLNMRRLQTLEHLTLYFMWPQTGVPWQDCIHLIQVIPPSVRKLSLEMFDVLKPLPPIHVMAEELVAELVRFEEVDFRSFLLYSRKMTDATLRRLTAVISSGEETKLKVLVMPAWMSSSRSSWISETLAEARKVLTVNFL